MRVPSMSSQPAQHAHKRDCLVINHIQMTEAVVSLIPGSRSSTAVCYHDGSNKSVVRSATFLGCTKPLGNSLTGFKKNADVSSGNLIYISSLRAFSFIF